MIPSARPTVSSVANIVFALFCFARFKKWGRTDNMCEKTMIPTGRDRGSAEWINLNCIRKICKILEHFGTELKKIGIFLVIQAVACFQINIFRMIHKNLINNIHCRLSENQIGPG